MSENRCTVYRNAHSSSRKEAAELKKWTKALKNISLLSQLGISLVMPILLCLAGCYALTTYLGAGVWIYIPGILFGIGGSFSTAYRFYRMVMKDEKKNDRAGSTSFNTHF